jgi:hypothetical protein
VLGTEVVEETAPFAEEHRDEMDLELVEDAASLPHYPAAISGSLRPYLGLGFAPRLTARLFCSWGSVVESTPN